MTRLKKINGRKRHILVDNNGFLLKCYIGPANENDRTGAIKLFANTAVNIKRVYADMGYTGHKLRDYILNNYQIELEVIKRPRKYYYALPDAPPLYMELDSSYCLKDGLLRELLSGLVEAGDYLKNMREALRFHRVWYIWQCVS